MGHEYVEMKNTPAAIEAYRHAVDINPRDYGVRLVRRTKTEMNYYALTTVESMMLRLYDSRMWTALAIASNLWSGTTAPSTA